MTGQCFQDFRASAKDLPQTLPLFPLPGALLLPQGRLPLNIFEPRYLNMTIDALQTPGRLIGMIQPCDGESMENCAKLYQTGCAGRISSFAETEDGRILLTLHGVCRFTVESENLTAGGYREARVNWQKFLPDLTEQNPDGIDRTELLQNLKRYFKHIKMPADWEAIEAAPLSVLINSLAMVCPFECTEQQALLEAASIADRAKVMNCLLKMSLHDGGENFSC